MGEIADMMLEGTLCAGCGEYLDGEGYGIPLYCGGCQPDYNGVHNDFGHVERSIPCPHCKKKFKNKNGLRQHIDAVHDIEVTCAECRRTFRNQQAHDQHFEAKHMKSEPTFKAYAPWDWDGAREFITAGEAEAATAHKANAWVDDPDGNLVCGSRYHLVKIK